MTDVAHQYPIGRFERPTTFSAAERARFIDELAEAPSELRGAVAGLDDAQLDTVYRESGWSVRQVVHHVADSHTNSFIRCKLALTEDAPVIKPYSEKAWAELGDSKRGGLEPSLSLLSSLHERWVLLLSSLPEDAFARTFVHPESGRTVSLDLNLALYAWHGKHHTAQITSLRERRGW